MSKEQANLLSQKIIKWGPWNSLLVSTLIYFIAQIGLFLPLMIWSILRPGASLENGINNSAWLNIALTGFTSLMIIGSLFIYLKIKKCKLSSLGFRRFAPKDFLWIIICLVVYLIVAAIVMVLAGLIPQFNPDQAQNLGLESAKGFQIVLAFTSLVIITPIAEEMLFRGFLYRGLSSRWPKIIAALITSILFALVHFQWNVSIDVFVLSLVLIFILEKTNNLWSCIILHSLKNLMAFLVIFVLGIR